MTSAAAVDNISVWPYATFSLVLMALTGARDEESETSSYIDSPPCAVVALFFSHKLFKTALTFALFMFSTMTITVVETAMQTTKDVTRNPTEAIRIVSFLGTSA